MNRDECKTKALEFFPCNPQRDRLFAVRDGIAVIDAIEQASTFLSAARAISNVAAEHKSSEMIFGVNYLICFAKAALDASIEGIMRDGDGSD